VNLIRLGDRLDEATLITRKPYFQAADNLAKRVFNPAFNKNTLDAYYIQSPKRENEESSEELEGDIVAFKNFGEYERTIFGKILNPERKVLCIVGPIGCGKTTTIRYILKRLIEQPCQGCQIIESCKRQKMILATDFNERHFKTVNSEEHAAKILLEEICNQMRAKLKVHGIPSREEELTQFWNEEIENLRSGDPQSSAFVRIVNILPEDSIIAVSPLSREELSLREKTLSSIEANKEIYLDYLIRLWGYVIRNEYGGKHGCALLAFDNIDKASPVVQSALLSIVQASARDPGPIFLLLVRPETFDRLGMATDIIDMERHRGPSPSHIVLNRLEKFVANPDLFFVDNEGLKQEEFNLVKNFILNVYRLIKSESQRTSPYITFLDMACGNSVRLALLTAQNLFRASEFDMLRDESLSIYSLIRLSVNQGESQFKVTQRSPIANLFHVKGEEDGRLLVKPRILKYLLASPERRRSLNDIKHTLKAFGYQELTLIRGAINETQNIYCQIVRSNGFDSYTEHEFLNAGTQILTLTKIGEGYGTHLLFSIDYIQEIMLDTYVSPERFGIRISYSYLTDKFLLLKNFLNELRLADVAETTRFIQDRSKNVYFNTFGTYLLSLEIIWEAYKAISRLISSLQQSANPPERRHERWLPYEDLMRSFDSLLNLVANDNHTILGIWPGFIQDANKNNL
jgi:ABC-type oligopeptide transport system ATPase subunit